MSPFENQIHSLKLGQKTWELPSGETSRPHRLHKVGDDFSLDPDSDSAIWSVPIKGKITELHRFDLAWNLQGFELLDQFHRTNARVDCDHS